MRGMAQLAELRKRRAAPSMVYVDCDPSGACADFCNATETGSNLEVWIEPEDNPKRLDFRAVAGLRVLVTGTNPKRVRDVAEALAAAGAAGLYVAFLGEAEPTIQPFFRKTDDGPMAA